MAIGAVLLLRTKARLSDDELRALRRALRSELDLTDDDLPWGDPLEEIQSEDQGPIPGRGGIWYNVRISRSWYAPSYRRGDIRTLARVAEWLECAVPTGEIWYGRDCDDDG